jgi:hypothetical protein
MENKDYIKEDIEEEGIKYTGSWTYTSPSIEADIVRGMELIKGKVDMLFSNHVTESSWNNRTPEEIMEDLQKAVENVRGTSTERELPDMMDFMCPPSFEHLPKLTLPSWHFCRSTTKEKDTTIEDDLKIISKYSILDVPGYIEYKLRKIWEKLNNE